MLFLQIQHSKPLLGAVPLVLLMPGVRPSSTTILPSFRLSSSNLIIRALHARPSVSKHDQAKQLDRDDDEDRWFLGPFLMECHIANANCQAVVRSNASILIQ